MDNLDDASDPLPEIPTLSLLFRMSPATAATSSRCCRIAATTSLSVMSQVVEALFEDDARVEKQVVMEIEGLGMLMLVDMSVRWSLNLNVLMKGLMIFILITHIKLAHLIALIFK